MPSTNGAAGVPPEVAPVVRRYHRVERAVSWLVALVIVAVAVAAFLSLDTLPAVLVAVGVVAVVRVPVVRRGGHTRLVADADPSAVAAAFRSPTPPILAFQWGIADGIEVGGGSVDGETDADPDGIPTTHASYEFSYLFGLRSASMELEVRTASEEAAPSPDGNEPVETLEASATANGRPWGTYRVSIRESDAGTVVDVELTTDRRFDLRSVPQTLVAERYFEAVLAAQGYRVADRSVSWST
ncbi:hypothetical protein SAMN04488066_1189 [Halorubrum aquaticum]|uniref:Uncharacterized protein n=1 Tax=Halorubrum aquaticum TaxID=387340 RepID=A0A1I3C2I8_9EURY|nr:hypothetical protein [Halorubrum aquaticum]SFH68785.1 hypothetical protein SAMN04488066_1189 [Halorubrum aquaticum]